MELLSLFRYGPVLILASALCVGCQRSNPTPPPRQESLVLPAGSAPKVGDLVPDFSLLDSKGQVHRLSDFRGNLVFLNFWATWCPPCIQEFPLMEAFNQSLKAKSFSMIGISVDKTWAEINSFLGSLNRKPTFLLLLDSEKRISTQYGTDKFPETFVIDPKGRLLKKYVGAFNWMEPKMLAEWEGFFEKAE